MSLVDAGLVFSSAYAESRGEPGRDSGKANPLNNAYF